MTFIVGLTCPNGIVLCADSLEDDGITKKTVNKIRMISMLNGGVAIAGSGPGPTIDKFCDEVQHRLFGLQAGRGAIESTIEDILIEFDSKYVKVPEDRFEVIVGAYSSPGFERLLYKGQGRVLSRSDESHTGMGPELWRMLADCVYSKTNCVADNIRLGVFATKLAIKYASRVDGPIQAISYTFGDQFWKYYSPAEIGEIESELSSDAFKAAVQKYWRLNNPPTHTEQVHRYKGVRTPGDELTILEGVRLEELYTVSGRRRASKTFRRNTDKLQQRASLVAKRYREAHPGASLPHDGKTRT